MEPNQFGTNEFIEWCRLTGSEPLLGLNFGTGSAEMAVALVEYCNVERGTKWSELRRSHGYAEPHVVKYWCLGNEMDGPWQIGQLQAREYGRKARDAAKQMRVIDRDLRLIACGSSGTAMPQYLVWDREVLEECYDMVDGLSLHAYYGNTQPLTGNNIGRFLAMNLDMDRQIRESPPSAITSRGCGSRTSGCGSRSTNGTSGTAPAAARRPTASGSSRRSSSRKSTTSRTRCSSAGS